MGKTVLAVKQLVEVPRLSKWGPGRVREVHGNLVIVDFGNRREGIVEVDQVRPISNLLNSRKG